MNELYIGLLVASFSLVIQAFWQIWRRFMNKRNALKALIGEMNINLEVVVHNRGRAENQVSASVAFQSYIPYQYTKLAEMLRDSEISIEEDLRSHLQKLFVQLMHQNEIIMISKSLWSLVLEKKEQAVKEINLDQDAIENILEQSLLSLDNLSPIQIFHKIIEQQEHRQLQISLANIMIGYTYDLETMLSDSSILIDKYNKEYLMSIPA